MNSEKLLNAVECSKIAHPCPYPSTLIARISKYFPYRNNDIRLVTDTSAVRSHTSKIPFASGPAESIRDIQLWITGENVE